MDADDTAEAETDLSTAAERVPIAGAYNITTLGDSLKLGWWEHAPRRIKWRNLRWWALGAVAVALPVWAVLWIPAHTKAAALVLFGLVLVAIPAVKVLRWYIETAEKWATLRLRRKQMRVGTGR